MQHSQANTLDNSTTDWHGGKPECWHNLGQAWQDSTRISTESKWQRQISAHVGKRERQWSISSSGVEGGQPNEQRCCDVRTHKEATFPSILEGSHRRMTRTGRQTWKLFEQRYGSQWPQVDSTRFKHGAEARHPHPHLTTPDPTLTNHLVTPTARAASAAEDRMLNTWRIVFKLAY